MTAPGCRGLGQKYTLGTQHEELGETCDTLAARPPPWLCPRVISYGSLLLGRDLGIPGPGPKGRDESKPEFPFFEAHWIDYIPNQFLLNERVLSSTYCDSWQLWRSLGNLHRKSLGLSDGRHPLPGAPRGSLLLLYLNSQSDSECHEVM